MNRDVVILGGGPAGLASAIAMRRRQFRVTVFDCGRNPIDKACGEGLMPEALESLKELGIEGDPEGLPIRGIRFLDGELTLSANFRSGAGLAVRRTRLHRFLVEHARSAGVELRYAERDVLPRLKSGADLVVGADGVNSAVRKAAGLNREWYRSVRYGFRQHFRVRPWSDYVDVHWGRNKQIYVAPVGLCEVGIILLTSDPHQRLQAALAEFPQLRERLYRAEPCSREAGAPTVFRRLRRVHEGTVALAGDASGSVDASTGQGLQLAFAQAQALAEAWSREDLEHYERAHERIAARARVMSRLLLLISRHAQVRRRVFSYLAGKPEVFEMLLGFHTGASTVCELAQETMSTLIQASA